MKLIVAVVQPTKLDAVREALLHIGVARATAADAQGFARQRGQTERFRGYEYQTNLLRKVALEVAVNDDFLELAVETLSTAARTGPEGNIGDGKVFVLPVERTVDIGDGRQGPEAV